MATVRTTRLAIHKSSFTVLAPPGDEPIEDYIERVLVSKLHNTPSDWGVMVSEHLLSLQVSDLVKPIPKGNQISIGVDAEYEAKGYRIGDVLFAVKLLKDPLAMSAPISSMRTVDIVGLPFSISVECPFEVATLNIMIVGVERRSSITYMAKPAFYPHYSFILASKMPLAVTETQFYSKDSVVPSQLSKLELQLLDPLADRTPTTRNRYLIADVRRALGIGPDKTVVRADMNPMYTGKVKATPANPLHGADVYLELIEVKNVEKKMEELRRNDIKYFDFIYTACIPLGFRMAVMVLWKVAPENHSSPIIAQAKPFAFAVDTYIYIKEMEAASLRRVYGKALEAGSKPSPQLQMLKEHLRVGEKIRTESSPEILEKAEKQQQQQGTKKSMMEVAGATATSSEMEGDDWAVKFLRESRARFRANAASRRGRGRGRGRSKQHAGSSNIIINIMHDNE
jgi:hypothetical protein